MNITTEQWKEYKEWTKVRKGCVMDCKYMTCYHGNKRRPAPNMEDFLNWLEEREGEEHKCFEDKKVCELCNTGDIKFDKKETKYCPHGRPEGRSCPHCMGINRQDLTNKNNE